MVLDLLLKQGGYPKSKGSEPFGTSSLFDYKNVLLTFSQNELSFSLIVLIDFPLSFT